MNTPARFSDNITLKEAQKAIYEACSETPTLPNHGSRLGAHLHRELIEGKANCKGAPYVVNIFDRSSPWIQPRYQKSYMGKSLRVVTADAVTWIEDRTGELRAMSEKVNAAILSAR